MSPIADSSQTATALNHKGCALCQQSQFNAALTAFDQAIKIAPDNCTFWNNKGNALYSLNRYAEALSAYDKAVALNPNYHQGWFNRGKLLAEIGAYGNALASYNRAIAIEPAPPYLHAREDIWVKGQLFTDNQFV